MGIRKTTKFPLDVSQENSKDMFRLKFIRKSEMEPTVRHHLKQAVSQMDKQLDVWYKEQTFTIGTIRRQQDKLSQSRTRLKKEQRKFKKQEYARKQEEIRSKLQELRIRMLLRKAVQKFKANVVRAHEYRNAALDKLGHQMEKPLSDISSRNTNDLVSENEQTASDQLTVKRDLENVLSGLQCFPSSLGRPMEPIPEEEVEIQVDENEHTEMQNRSITKRRLNQLNRTKSTRTVLDIKATVPLLPDLYPQRKFGKPYEEGNDASLERAKDMSSDSEKPEQAEKKTKSLIVKLPVATTSTDSIKTLKAENIKTSRSDSFKSSKSLKASVRGEHGSDTEFSDDGSESDVSVVGSDSMSQKQFWDNTSDYESYSKEEFVPAEVRLALKQIKRKRWENGADVKKTEEVHSHRKHFPDENILPELAILSDSKHRQIQNPYFSVYKERSFYIEPSSTNTLTNSTDDFRVTKFRERNMLNLTTDFARETRTVTQNEAVKDMTIFGRKAGYNARKPRKTPPNTPASNSTARRLSPRSHPSVGAINKKRAQSLDKYKQYQSLDEPFQRYERSKTGKLVPLGSPKTYHSELPSMRYKYQRDKLLKMERDTQFNQNMKMKRFFSTFDKDKLDIPTPTGHSPSKLDPFPCGGSSDRNKPYTKFIFKVLGPEDNDSFRQKKIIPGAETTSVRLLKNCRYLREYKPPIYPLEKETSWQMKASPDYRDKCLTNIRLTLF